MPDSSTYPTKKGISGVYEIYCSANHASYIGSAQCLMKRRLNHLAMLRNGKHTSIHLQRAWNLYGEATFEFRVIEFCAIDSLLDREQYYLDLLHPKLNIAIDASANMRGHHHSAETNRILSAIQKDRMRVGGGYRENISQKLTGRKQPMDVIEKRITHLVGKVRTEETKQKTSKSLQGIHHSQERNKNTLIGIWNGILKAANEDRTIGKQKFIPSQIIEIRRLHIEGMNYVELSEKFNTVPTTIRAICLRLSYKHIP